MAAFWSHALTSHSAATDDGTAPPITHAKNRPDPLASCPPSAAAASSSTTTSAGSPLSGRGASNRRRSSSRDTVAATDRVSRESSQE